MNWDFFLDEIYAVINSSWMQRLETHHILHCFTLIEEICLQEILLWPTMFFNDMMITTKLSNTGCLKKKYNAQNRYSIQTTNDRTMKQTPIDRWYSNLKFTPHLSFEGSYECGKNVNLRLGQEGTPRTWSVRVRNGINVIGFILLAMLNWI